jgi:hypothetical protein
MRTTRMDDIDRVADRGPGRILGRVRHIPDHGRRIRDSPGAAMMADLDEFCAGPGSPAGDECRCGAQDQSAEDSASVSWSNRPR